MSDLMPCSAVPAQMEPVTAEQVYSGWLLRFKSPHTRRAYERDIQRWLGFLRRVGVDALAANTDHVSAYMRLCEQEINPRTGQPVTATTVARRVSVVSSFYRHCKRRRVIAENPAEEVDRPDVDPDYSPTVGLTGDEARRLITTAETRALAAAARLVEATGAGHPAVRLHTSWLAAERDYTIIAVLLCTGGRTAEIATALIEDLGYDRGVRVLHVTRKGGKRQGLALGESARVVDRYLTIIGRTAGPLFLTSRGTTVDRAWLFRQLRIIAEAAHIPAAKLLSLHGLRHTFGTLSFDLGANLDDVQTAMGHADPRTTRRYDRARNRIDRSPVHVVSRALLGRGDG